MSRVMKAVPLVVLFALIIAVPSVWANWVQDGVVLCNWTWHQHAPTITSDGAGGAIVTWMDYRNGNNYDIYAQRVNASGSVQWTANGVALCTATGDQLYPTITSDGAGGAIVTWMDYRSATGYDIYTQRVNALGAVQWTANGVALCTATGDQYHPMIVSDGAGGAIVTWYDGRIAGNDIYVQRVNASGAVQWTANGVALCTATGIQWYPAITSDGAGGAIVTWYDQRGGTYGIYAQRVDASGAIQWTADGVALCTATWNEIWPTITSDGAGGAVVTWMDDRNASYDIYAQRVNASGAVQWTTDGVAICTATGDQAGPTIVSDGAGGGIVTWYDGRSENAHIYAQRVNASGAVQWTANGKALCTATGDQLYPTITSDGAGGAIVTWVDFRSGSYNADIYAQRVNDSGAVQWTANGVALCTATGDQWSPTIVSDCAGGGIVTWQDYRSGSNYDVYAQRVDAAGHSVVATLLQNYATTFSGDRIAITWTLSEIDEGIEFSVERATASDGPFIELPSSAVRRDGLSFTFTDSNWQPNMSYWYRVECQIGNERKVLFETGPVATPALPLTLYQNSPNPFNPSTTIGYYLPEKCRVRLEIYGISGRRIASLVNREQEKDRYAIEWNGKDEHGNSVASGIYFYKLIAGKKTVSRKMVLIR